MSWVLPPALVASYLVLWVFVVVSLCVQIVLLRHLGFLFRVLDPIMKFRDFEVGLRLGGRLPSIPLSGSDGQPVSLRNFRGMPLLLLVVQHPCAPCDPLLRGIGENLLDKVAAGWKPIVIATGYSDGPTIIEELSWDRAVTVLSDSSRSARRHWRIDTLPSAIFVDHDGRAQAIWENPDVGLVQALLGEPPSLESFLRYRGQAKPSIATEEVVGSMSAFPPHLTWGT
jgi:hypothetical protein